MIRRLPILILCAALAACGVDGEPEAPEQQPTADGAATTTTSSTSPPPYVSGSVAITNNGVYPSIGVSQGWWSIYVGRGGWWY